jgi:hypothetical protein
MLPAIPGHETTPPTASSPTAGGGPAGLSTTENGNVLKVLGYLRLLERVGLVADSGHCIGGFEPRFWGSPLQAALKGLLVELKATATVPKPTATGVKALQLAAQVPTDAAPAWMRRAGSVLSACFVFFKRCLCRYGTRVFAWAWWCRFILCGELRAGKGSRHPPTLAVATYYHTQQRFVEPPPDRAARGAGGGELPRGLADGVGRGGVGAGSEKGADGGGARGARGARKGPATRRVEQAHAVGVVRREHRPIVGQHRGTPKPAVHRHCRRRRRGTRKGVGPCAERGVCLAWFAAPCRSAGLPAG